MPPFAELPPVTDERRLAVAQWVETNVRPVLHAVAENAPQGGQPQQEFELRDYQVDAWANLDIAREAERVRALGNLATGLGKTFVAAVDVMRYREWCAAQDPPMIPRILYVSHQHDINEQAAKTFSTVMPNAEIDFFKTRREELPDSDITFATIQSLYSELERFDPQDFEYIIWDESHHLEAETFKAVRDYFDPLFEHAITATIERMDKKDIQEYFGTPLYQKTLPEGIAEGHLVGVEYHIVFDKAIKEKLKEGFNPKTLEEIKELFKDKPPREAIARNIQEEVERLGLEDPKTIVFCDSIEEAEDMAELLGGIAYHSQTKDRKEILRGFRAGQHRIITTRDMFNEGVDIPDAELIVFLRSTGSPTIFEQQLGRGLRRAPGKTKVIVLDFVANIERIAKVRELADQIRQARPARQGGGEDGEGIDDLPIEDWPISEEGLQIHTPHGDFDFDKIAVDLLEKWRSLREASPSVGLSNVGLVTLALTIKPDGPLTRTEISDLSRRGEFISQNTVIGRFGSIRAFQEACGFEVKAVANMTDEELITLALELKPEGALTQGDIRKLSKSGQFVSPGTVATRFGSIRAFQEACGFSVRGSWSNERIVALARTLKPDGWLTVQDINELSRAGRFVSYDEIKQRFGSIRAFQKMCEEGDTH